MDQFNAAPYQRFDENDQQAFQIFDPIESQPRSTNKLKVLGGATVAVLAAASAFAMTGYPALPIAQIDNTNVSKVSKETVNANIDNVVYQMTSIRDPTGDLCSDPYKSVCGKFDREYKLKPHESIQTWGFNQVEDEMAKQSLIPLSISCDDAIASDEIDQWTTFMACSFKLCSNDGRFHESEFNQPSTAQPLHQYAPNVDAVLREYLPITRLSSDEQLEVTSSDKWPKFFAAYLGDLHRIGNQSFVSMKVSPDVTFDNGNYDLKFQSGQTFYGNKDQYNDKDQVETLIKYLTGLLTAHVEDIQGTSVDQEDVDARIHRVIEFEKSVAEIKLSEKDKRDQIAINNPGRALLFTEQMSKFIDLDVYVSHKGSNHFSELMSNTEQPVIFEDPTYLDLLSDVIGTTENDVILDYLLLLSLDMVASHLTPNFRKVAAEWVNIQDGAPPGDTKAVCRKWVADDLSWIMGRDIVKSAKNAEIRRNLATRILTDIKNEYYDMVEESWWMDEESKKGARMKLDKMSQQVGWPDWLVDDSPDGYESYFKRFYLPEGADKPDLKQLQEDLKADDADKKTATFLKSSLVLKTAMQAEIMNRIDSELDIGIWDMCPQDVNAEYFPSTNNFMLPWGVLQEPMMYEWSDGPYENDRERQLNLALKAVSYGGVGSVTSHEIMHGFDDDGRTHDFKGQLNPFSTPKADKNFQTIIQCISDEYASFTVDIGNNKTMHLNGPMTQGENLADNGGLQTLQRLSLSGKLVPKEDLDKTPLKEFGIDTPLAAMPFTAFGSLWCEKSTPEFSQNHAETNPHAPGDKRIVGVFSNLNKLAQHLNCPSGTTMNPKTIDNNKQDDLQDRNFCKVW